MSSPFRAFLLFLAVIPFLGRAQTGALTPKQVYERCRDSVVSIEVQTPKGIASGTGFFYENERTVATAFHVIDEAQRITIKGRNGARWVPTSITFDDEADLVLLRLAKDSGRKPILHAASQTVGIGDPIYVIGDPLGLTGSLSTGVVGALRTESGVPLLQITAPISPGSSGGPVLDAQGRAVGVVSFTFTEGQNVNVAVGTKVAKALMTSQQTLTVAEYIGLLARMDKVVADSEVKSDKTEEVDRNVAEDSERRTGKKISAALGNLCNRYHIAEMDWSALWTEQIGNHDFSLIDRFREMKRTIDDLGSDEKWAKLFDDHATEAGVSQQDAKELSTGLRAIEKAASDNLDAMILYHRAAREGKIEKLDLLKLAQELKSLQLKLEMRRLLFLLTNKDWCDTETFMNAIAPAVFADWILDSQFGAHPNLNSALVSIRYVEPLSSLKPGDVIVGIALNQDHAEFTIVRDWADFNKFCDDNEDEDDEDVAFKLKVRRGASDYVLHPLKRP